MLSQFLSQRTKSLGGPRFAGGGDLLHALVGYDAVCINQQDMEERSQQVRLISDIFKAAAQTTVWLGSETENSVLAVERVWFCT